MVTHKFSKTAFMMIALILLGPFFMSPRQSSTAAQQVTIRVVTSYFEIGDDFDRVYVAAEIENSSNQYLKHVAVQAALKSPEGDVIQSKTGSAKKSYLAPGEKTFYYDTIFDDSSFLTSSVEFSAFGDPSNAQEYPYFADPQPEYLESSINGETVYYYGEFVNKSETTWETNCKYCDSLDLVGAYYDNGELVGYQTIGVRPDGHIAPGGKLVFRFYFDRVLDGSFKLFSAAKPLKNGEYPTTWAVEDLKWDLVDGIFGNEIDISAAIRNLSVVPAQPNISFIGRDKAGKWIGWTSCLALAELEQFETINCAEEISQMYMHAGKPEDITEIEVLVASSAVTNEAPEIHAWTYFPFINHIQFP